MSVAEAQKCYVTHVAVNPNNPVEGTIGPNGFLTGLTGAPAVNVIIGPNGFPVNNVGR